MLRNRMSAGWGHLELMSITAGGQLDREDYLRLLAAIVLLILDLDPVLEVAFHFLSE